MLLTWLQWKRIWKCISGPHFTTVYFNSVEHAPFHRNKCCTENQMWMNLNLKTVYCLSYVQLSIIPVRTHIPNRHTALLMGTETPPICCSCFLFIVDSQSEFKLAQRKCALKREQNFSQTKDELRGPKALQQEPKEARNLDLNTVLAVLYNRSRWNICCPYPSGQQMFHQRSIIQLCQDKNLIFGWQLNH